MTLKHACGPMNVIGARNLNADGYGNWNQFTALDMRNLAAAGFQVWPLLVPNDSKRRSKLFAWRDQFGLPIPFPVVEIGQEPIHFGQTDMENVGKWTADEVRWLANNGFINENSKVLIGRFLIQQNKAGHGSFDVLKFSIADFLSVYEDLAPSVWANSERSPLALDIYLDVVPDNLNEALDWFEVQINSAALWGTHIALTEVGVQPSKVGYGGRDEPMLNGYLKGAWQIASDNDVVSFSWFAAGSNAGMPDFLLASASGTLQNPLGITYRDLGFSEPVEPEGTTWKTVWSSGEYRLQQKAG